MTETAPCPSSVSTRPEDFQRFGEDAMPTGQYGVVGWMPCELPTGHNGPHLYGIQIESPGPSHDEDDAEVCWWAVWGEGQPVPYAITSRDICPETYDRENDEPFLCCLPIGHEGPHGPGAGGEDKPGDTAP